MRSASSIERTRGRMTSFANLLTESFIRDSVSERCEIGVGVRSVRSVGSPYVVSWRGSVDVMGRIVLLGREG